MTRLKIGDEERKWEDCVFFAIVFGRVSMFIS